MTQLVGQDSQNSSARTADWLGKVRGQLIYAYDLGAMLKAGGATVEVRGARKTELTEDTSSEVLPLRQEPD
jgi:hypothetical protein